MFKPFNFINFLLDTTYRLSETKEKKENIREARLVRITGYSNKF